MKYIKGENREQIFLFPISLDDSIEEENEVRLIDAFVESLKIEDLGFSVNHIENGRPAYHPKDLLKLFIYGYLNRIRSSRTLEKECKRNIELIWLLKSLQPDHNTISNFRRDNSKSIKRVFRKTVEISKYFHLIGSRLIAGDSTKFRAQNSKKNNYNKKKISRHIEYIEKKIDEYQKQLKKNDGDKEEVKSEILTQNTRKKKYKQLETQLDKTGENQISTSDSESRQMIIRNNITEVAYNVQTTIDALNNIPIDYLVTNNNDSKAMGKMLRRSKSILRTNKFTALFDKGYHTGSEFKIANDLKIDVMVAIPGIPTSSKSPDPDYNLDKFIYNSKTDTYQCPEGEILKSNGNWYNGKNYKFKQYKTTACKSCSKIELCTKCKRNGRIVQRSEYSEYINNNKTRVNKNKDYYRRRQAIVEHPFGTIKRQWGFNYVLTKQGINRSSSDVGFMFIAYNLRRIINLIGFKSLIGYFERLGSIISYIMDRLALNLRIFKQFYYLNKFWFQIYNFPINAYF